MSRTRKPEADNLSLGIHLLEYLAGQQASRGVTQVASHFGLPPSRTHDLLQLLCALGFSEQDKVSRRYRVSPQIFTLAHAFSGFGIAPIIQEFIRERAQKLKCSIYISALWRKETYVVCASGEFGDSVSFGAHGYVHVTAAGKAIVSRLPKESWKDYAPQDARLRTKFRAELTRAAEEGVAWNERASTANMCSVAAPLAPARAFRYSVSIVLPYPEWRRRSKIDLAHEARELAGTIDGSLSAA